MKSAGSVFGRVDGDPPRSSRAPLIFWVDLMILMSGCFQVDLQVEINYLRYRCSSHDQVPLLQSHQELRSSITSYPVAKAVHRHLYSVISPSYSPTAVGLKQRHQQKSWDLRVEDPCLAPDLTFSASGRADEYL